MCGIAGAYFLSGNSEVLTEELANVMLDSIQHRGPDDGGYAIDSHAFIGYRRLSILDITDAGNQPFFSDDGALWLVFNGEIFNYIELRKELENEFIFESKSDTEVLLRAYQKWGIGCLDRLVGMFAFAIWERDSMRLTLCRDRLGKKPLYFYHDGSTFYFASEIKALLAAGVPAGPDNSTFSDYLLFGHYDHSSHTFFQNIKQLGRGFYMQIDRTGIREECYWNLAERVLQREPMDPSLAEQEYMSILDESIRIRMRSDVPVAITLSGGLDSSFMATLAEKYNGSSKLNVMTFRTDDPRYDESPWAKALSSEKNWNQIIGTIEPSFVQENLPALLWHQEEPFGGIASFADIILASLARDNGIYVLLEGQGADETLGGYDYYIAYYLYDVVQRDPTKAKEIYQEYARLRGLDTEASISSVTKPIEENLAGFSQDRTQATNPKSLRPDLINFTRVAMEKTDYSDKFSGALLRDLTMTKVPRVLRFKDKSSMMYGIELRNPFLDHRLTELSFMISANRKLTNGFTKFCLRQAASTVLHQEIAFHIKRQVQTPQREWLRTSLRHLVEEAIFSESFSKRDFFEHKILKDTYKTYVEYPQNFANSFFIWQWVMVEWWHRLFIDRSFNVSRSYRINTKNSRRYPPTRS